MPRKRTIAALLLALALLAPAAAGAATLQPIGKFDQPIYVTSDPGNPNRLFVAEREGTIRQVQDGVVSTFADVSSVVGCGGGCAGERGLLSIAPAPDFDTSGRLYIDYAQNVDGSLHVAELTASGATAPLGSLRDVLTIPHPEESNHNGGQLQFGPDGYLYISTGDGGGNDDEHGNAQNLDSLLGKILRIDPRQSGVLPYTVPAGNPFAGAEPPANAIWSYGLRNPFRFSFDRLGSGLTIGDVGQYNREEVDYAAAPGFGAGANFGWNCWEGTIPGPETDEGCKDSEPGPFVKPIFDYPHSNPDAGKAFGCAIIGGYVVADASLGDLFGRYLYGDLCTGQLRSFSLASPYATDRAEGIAVEELNSFGEDSCGRVYTVSAGGQVSRLTGTLANDCAPPAVPQGTTFLGLRAAKRRVQRHSKVLLTSWVSPCGGRRGARVRLYRGRRLIGSGRLGRACTVQFRPRILRRSKFHTTIAEDANHLGAVSRRLKIRIDHRRSTRRKARAGSLSGRARWP
jgi:glucose/arabinose dehydrogenase